MFNPFKFIFRAKLNTPVGNVPKIPTSSGRSSKKGEYLSEYAFNIKWQIMEERMNTTNLVLIVAFLGLFICFITLYFDYQQFQSNSYNSYLQAVNELSNQKDQLLQNKIDFLLKTATSSSKIN
jgi:hypothetical protein